VTDADARAAGVVTDRDFVRKVVAGGVATHLPVTAIMTAPVIDVESSEGIFQALLTMLGRNLHHLLVTEDGKPTGVLTSHDLMLLQAKSPLSLARNIEQQRSVDDFAVAQSLIDDRFRTAVWAQLGK